MELLKVSFLGEINCDIQEVKDILNFLRLENAPDGLPIKIRLEGKGIHVKKSEGEIDITCGKVSQIYRALSLIRINADKDEYMVSQTENYEELSYMIDCSRNAVPRLSVLKKLIVQLAVAGFNQLQLYIEDTLEIDGEPYVGTFRGRYKKSDIKEISDYCNALGIELVPCIQTLAHLNQIFQWREYQPICDTADILLIGDERSYQLIENTIKVYKECTNATKINIGMDEAFLVGLGNYRVKNGNRERLDIMLEHLKRVEAICKKYGMEPMMWSDMMIHFALIGNPMFKRTIDHRVVQRFPKDIRLVYWDYFSFDYDGYVETLDYHKEMSNRIGYAGGVWKWVGFAPLYSFSFQASRASLMACKKSNIKNVMLTAWCDGGAESSHFTSIPFIYYYAEHCYTEEDVDKASLSLILEKLYGLTLEDFMWLEMPNYPYETDNRARLTNYAKAFTYNDLLLGTYDVLAKAEYETSYAAYATKLRKIAKKTTEYGYIYETLARLCELLSVKVTWGKNARECYKKHDKQGLRILSGQLDEMKDLLENFLTAFRAQWDMENNSVGFDVLDIRFGGLLMRMHVAKRKIEDYLTEKTDKIDELEETLVWKQEDLTDDIYIYMRTQKWSQFATNNVI